MSNICIALHLRHTQDWILQHTMSFHQNQKSNPDQTPSFEDVSKFFSLSLSEAADILGVSTSVLKKVCIENGLERWPHRKYLAGKSIEDIKKEAAREKSKSLSGNSQIERQKGNVLTGSVISVPTTSQLKDRNSKAHGSTQGGVKNVYSWRAQNLLNSGIVLETSTGLDEFKYGFPSNGLSNFSVKWWGSGSEDKKAAATRVNDGTVSMNEDSDHDASKAGSLLGLRKSARDEGRDALRLGVWKEDGVDMLGEKEKKLLQRLFATN